VTSRPPYGWSFALGAAAVVLSVLPLALRASASGALPARTGGFGEMTCQQCHWENRLNDLSGQLRLDGMPDAYTPGQQYLITVTLARPGVTRAGFQLSAREDGINMNAGADAGVLRTMDALTETVQESAAKRVTYLQHTAAGTQMRTPGTAKWMFEWTAPEGPVPVVFHVAANASNGDDSPLGDFIYTATAATKPAP
jgi:hypothetical protein